MRDFTLSAYARYLQALQSNGYPFVLFRDVVGKTLPAKFCLLRHDVDRKSANALAMARLEQQIGVVGTYYFRNTPGSFDPATIKAIHEMGHEVGYHYENLSDTNGDYPKALVDFQATLAEFRRTVPIHTISMHGSPLKPFDNRDLWRDPGNHAFLTESLGISGEVYLDIDYSDIAYINDTGRNWNSQRANLRDKVCSLIPADFESGDELLDYLKGHPHPRICFQIHPERWTDELPGWVLQGTKDYMLNSIKSVLKVLRT